MKIYIAQKLEQILNKIKTEIKDKDLLNLITDYGSLDYCLGLHNADPERYANTLDDMYLPPSKNMYDTCHCHSPTCKNDTCARKSKPADPVFTSSDFSNFCASYTEKTIDNL